MTTIPQRLREIAVRIGTHDMAAYVQLRAIAAELEAPAADASAAGALPHRDPTKTNEQQGLYGKFSVRRTDGSDAPGGKHHGCEYFVLDVTHDKHAKAALTAYADAVSATHPHLAADMRTRWGRIATSAADAVSAEVVAEYLYGHPRSKAVEWAKEDKFDSCYRQAEEICNLLKTSALQDRIKELESRQAELQRLAEIGRLAVPPENTPEAANAIDAALAEYDYPANARNAARAGWRACRQYSTGKEQP